MLNGLFALFRGRKRSEVEITEIQRERSLSGPPIRPVGPVVAGPVGTRSTYYYA